MPLGDAFDGTIGHFDGGLIVNRVPGHRHAGGPSFCVGHAAHDTIDVTGREFERTKKFRDVARSGRAAIVIDDLASVDPWRPRAIEVRGSAEAVHGPQPLIRIHPERIVSWGIEPEKEAAA